MNEEEIFKKTSHRLTFARLIGTGNKFTNKPQPPMGVQMD